MEKVAGSSQARKGSVDCLPTGLARTLDLILRHSIRRPALSRTAETSRVVQLAETGALVEATLAVLELELPSWTLRRIGYEDGLWTCSLSEQPDLPIEVDDMAEAQRGDLPHAIVAAVTEAFAYRQPAGRGRRGSGPSRAAPRGLFRSIATTSPEPAEQRAGRRPGSRRSQPAERDGSTASREWRSRSSIDSAARAFDAS